MFVVALVFVLTVVSRKHLIVLIDLRIPIYFVIRHNVYKPGNNFSVSLLVYTVKRLAHPMSLQISGLTSFLLLAQARRYIMSL